VIVGIYIDAGQNCSRKLYGGIGISSTKGKSRFPVVNVATEVNSVEQVLLLAKRYSILANYGLNEYTLFKLYDICVALHIAHI
jgi:hypothetical protein